MPHRKGCLERRLDAHRSRVGAPVFVAVLGALILVACAPAADSTGWSGAPKVELEVMVATDCEAGVAVVAVVDGKTSAFADLELAESGDPNLPYVASVRVPGRRGAPYRVTMSHGCDDARQMEITTYRVEGDARTIVATTTTTGRGQAESAGSM